MRPLVYLCSHKRIFLGQVLLVPILALSLLSCTTDDVYSSRRQRVFCKYVIDGDTIVLADGRKVRYLDINAPEIPHKGLPGEPLGMEAANLNRRLVQGKFIDILSSDSKPYDRFGRVLAHCFLPDGRLVSEVLLQNGLAHVCFFNGQDRLAKRLLSAQAGAIRFRRGIWGIKFTTSEPYYIGNRSSLRFHRPWCPFGKRISPQNRVIFKNREEAFLKGYCRCKKCLP